MPWSRNLFTAFALALCGCSAWAHDTWFQPMALAADAVPLELALGTGNRYPVQETGVGAEYLARQGCQGRDEGAAIQPMRATRNVDHALVLQVPRQAARCWAQLVPLDIELAPAKVAIYLQEVQASPELRDAWRSLQARGLPWKERYTKHARIDLGVDAVPPALAIALPTTLPTAVPMATDILRLPRAGGGFSFQVLRNGEPLAQQAMELISEAGTHGIWRRTDAQGRIELPALPAGRWLLRGTALRLSDEDPTRWDSGFVTLAFEVPASAAAVPLRSAAR